ncbi:hypothetical protein VNO80_21606 [Phaseolus coccineus]|uniref:starch synthase n=1 Tax=Phaseolus coccineus TaxID=3886 RepID=A0AAN9M6H0_PHACN
MFCTLEKPVIVPDQVLVLDWVFADGAPQKAEEQLLYRKFQEERRLRDEAMRRKAEKTAQMKAEAKEKTLKRFLLSQKHIVFTDPLDVRAGVQ